MAIDYKQYAFKLIIELEGDEYTNDPSDSGGETKYGIIKEVYEKYLDKNGLDNKPVYHMTLNEALSIYESNYWKPMKCDFIRSPLSIFLFQFGVNCGIRNSIMLIQKYFRLQADGIIGPNTLKILNTTPNILDIVEDIQTEYYDSICVKYPKNIKFKKGWYNRVNLTKKFIYENFYK